MICFSRELIYIFIALVTQILSYPDTEIESSIQDKKQIDITESTLTTTYYLSVKSKKNINIKQSQKYSLQNQKDYKTDYGYNFKTKDDNIDIDTKSIQRKSIRTQNSIMQSKYHPKTFLTVVETSFFNPDTNIYKKFLTPVTLMESKTKNKHFAKNIHGIYKTIADKTETANKLFDRKKSNSTQNSVQQSDYLTGLITTVTTPEISSISKTTKKMNDLRNRQRYNLKTKVSKTDIESQNKISFKSTDYSDTVKNPEIGNYTSLFNIARRLSNPFPEFNDPDFQNILNEYRAKVQRPLNINRDPRQFDQQNIINKMQEYQKMARFNGVGVNGPGQYNQNNPGRSKPNRNHQGFKYPRNIYSPMTGPRQTPGYRGYHFPVKMAWQTRTGWQQRFVGQYQDGRPGRQGQYFGPDREIEEPVPDGEKSDEWQAYKMPQVTEPPPPIYYHDKKPGETIDFFATAPHEDDHENLPGVTMNFTAEIPILTTILTRFTTILTTTTRRLRTTPARPNFDEDCDYTAYYCLKAYDTGQVCARTLYNKYATFKNYCMVDFVNCMERYETWVIIHMGECFEIKLVSQYVHYPYMDDYFLDQYYINENM